MTDIAMAGVSGRRAPAGATIATTHPSPRPAITAHRPPPGPRAPDRARFPEVAP